MKLAARGRLDQRGGKGHPNQMASKTDLEGEVSRVRQGDVEHQHGAGLDLGDPGGRFAELHGTVAAHQLVPVLIDEPDSHQVLADFGPATFHPKDQVGARMGGRKAGDPDMLKDAQHRKLALLVDQGVVSQDRKVDMHRVRRPGST